MHQQLRKQCIVRARLPNAQTGVQDIPYAVCGDKWHRDGFLADSVIFPRQCHPTPVPYILMNHVGGWTVRPLEATVPQTHSVTPL
jgi:hypothetical protein